VTYDVKEAVEDADVINLLRIQLERQNQNMFPSLREYAMKFGLDAEKMKYAKKTPGQLVSEHPGAVVIPFESVTACQSG
jgi:aspartate carbamoyltransferase catalytic subunit